MRSIEANLLYTFITLHYACICCSIERCIVNIVNECQNNKGQARLARFGDSILQLAKT